MSYAESDDDEDAFDPAGISTQRKRIRKPLIADDEDEEEEFVGGVDGAADEDGKAPDNILNT